MVNSHKQTPESLLKNFSYRVIETNKDGRPVKSQYVFCLNLHTKDIAPANIKTLNAEFGYYSDEAERRLSEIESSFGQCVTDIQNFIKANFNKTDNSFDIFQYEQTVKDFVYYSMARAKSFINRIQSKSVFYPFFPDYFSHSNIINKSGQTFEKLKLLDDYALTVALSEHYNFVLPKYCWYGGFINNETITLPITPNLAFILFPRKNLSDFLMPTKELGIVTFEKEDIQIANRIALMNEQRFDNEFIVAKQKQELIDLIPYIK